MLRSREMSAVKSPQLPSEALRGMVHPSQGSEEVPRLSSIPAQATVWNIHVAYIVLA